MLKSREVTMPPRTHSILAPSSKEWVHCGLAAKFLAAKEESDAGEAALFGTEAHALAEAYIKASLNLAAYDANDGLTAEQVKATLTMYDDEMEYLASGYANFVVDTAAFEERRTGEKPVVLVEQYLEMDYAPDTHGMLNITTGVENTPIKTVIYGAEGVGKSSLAAKFPNPLFLDTEGGTSRLNVRRVRIQGWEELLGAVKEIIAEPSVCKSLVVDTADWAEAFCIDYICKKYRQNSIESFGYGNGSNGRPQGFGKSHRAFGRG